MSSTLPGSPRWWQAGGIYSSPRLPWAPTWLADSHLQEGHFLTVPADLWVGWSPTPLHTSEQINTSEFAAGSGDKDRGRGGTRAHVIATQELPLSSPLRSSQRSLFGAFENGIVEYRPWGWGCLLGSDQAERLS